MNGLTREGLQGALGVLYPGRESQVCRVPECMRWRVVVRATSDEPELSGEVGEESDLAGVVAKLELLEDGAEYGAEYPVDLGSIEVGEGDWTW